MNKPVRHGIRQCRVFHHLVPVRHGKLAGCDCCVAMMSVIEHLQQVLLLGHRNGCECPVVQNQDMNAGHLL